MHLQVIKSSVKKSIREFGTIFWVQHILHLQLRFMGYIWQHITVQKALHSSHYKRNHLNLRNTWKISETDPYKEQESRLTNNNVYIIMIFSFYKRNACSASLTILTRWPDPWLCTIQLGVRLQFSYKNAIMAYENAMYKVYQGKWMYSRLYCSVSCNHYIKVTFCWIP